LGSIFLLGIFGCLAYTLDFFEFDDLNPRDFLLWDDKKVVAWDKMVAAENYIEGYNLYSSPLTPLRSKTIADLNPTIMY